MLSYETRNKICELLLAISDGERQIEIVRQILAEQKDFEPYAAFKRIDRNRKSSINIVDIKAFLSDNGIHYKDNAMHTFIKKYDLNEDGALSYDEFLIIVLPMDNPVLRAIATQRPNYDVGVDEFLPYDVEYALAKVLDKEVSFYVNLDFQKAQVINRPDFNIADAFSAIDRFNSGRIDYDNLKVFFRSQALFPYDEELIAILRRLDKDDDGLIKFEEFSEAFDLVDPNLKNNVGIKYPSPLKKSLQKNISRKELASQKASPLKTTTSPISKSPLRQTIENSGLKAKVNNYYGSNYKNKNNNNIIQSVKTQSPFRTIDETKYNEKLLNSVGKSYKKSTLSPSKLIQLNYSSSRPRSGKVSRGYEYDNRNYEEDNPLIFALHQFILLDKELELVRQELSLRPDFNLLDFFRMFDVNTRGTLTSGEIEAGMKEFGVFPNQDDLYLFCRRYDRDTDGKLKFVDFVEAFTPKQSEYASLLNNRSPLNEIQKKTNIMESLSFETKRLIVKAIRLHLENEASMERQRQKLNRRHDFNIHDAFSYLDVNEDGFLTIDELKVILERHSINITENELNLLFDRFDTNKDEKISYSEFVQEISSKSEKL